jgi:hypothetical protein
MNLSRQLKNQIRSIIAITIALSGAAGFFITPANADQLLATITPDAQFKYYWGAATSNNGQKLYLVANGSGVVTLDISNTASIPAPIKTPFTTGIQGNRGALSPDGTKFYVAGGNSGPAITVVDVSGGNAAQESFTVRATDGSAMTGFFPVALSRDGMYVYTSHSSSPCVYRFKTDRSSGQETLCLSGTPTGAKFGGNLILDEQKLYLRGYKTSSSTKDKLLVVDISSSEMSFNSEFWTFNTSDGDLNFIRNDNYIYSYNATEILKIDISNNNTSGNADIQTYQVPGTTSISNLFVTPDQKYAYLVDNWDYRVKKYDLVASAFIASPELSFPADSFAWFLSYDSINGLLVMADDFQVKIVKIGSPVSNVGLPQNTAALAKIAEEARARAVEAAKTEIKSVLSSGKPLTADQLLSADFNGVTSKNIDLVNADIAKLLDVDKTDLKQIEKVVLKFATVDKLAEGKAVYSSDLITVGLIPQDSKIKSSITSALKKLPGSSLDSYEKIQAEIAAVEKKHADRKARLAALLAKKR